MKNIRVIAVAVIAGARWLTAEAQVYIPQGEFVPRVRIEAAAPSEEPASSESDSISEPARWQNLGYAVGVGCRSNGQIPPPPRNAYTSCPSGVDSAQAGVELTAGRIRIGADTSYQGLSSASAEIRDYVTVTGPGATVPVTWTFNVEGNISRRLQSPNGFTDIRSGSASLDAWVQLDGVFTEGHGDDLGIAVHAVGSVRREPDQPNTYFSSNQVAPLQDPYQGDLTYSLAGLHDSSDALSGQEVSMHVFPSPARPVPPSITVDVPTGTPLPLVIGAYASSQCYTTSGTCDADADFGNTIYIIASVPNGYTLTSQGGFSYTGNTTPPAPANPGTVQFSESEGSVDEGVGTHALQVTRAGGADGEVSVRVIARATGAAAENADYAPTDTVVTFANGDTTAKTVNITIIDDALDEPNESFTVELTNATGGATLGPTPTTLISIRDNDLPPGPPAVITSGGGGTFPVEMIVALFLLLLLKWRRRAAGAAPARK